MFHYRTTKYDPMLRDSNGHYVKDEWTSYSDVGRIYNNTVFTLEAYLETEKIYSKAINSFMDCLNVTHLRIRSLEKNTFPSNLSIYSIETINVVTSLQEGMYLDKNTILFIVPLILREIIWCKLESETMYIHFGYDYYMYIGSKDACLKAIDVIQYQGLFVELYESPYL
jgi:hypothetical protein